MSSLSIHNLWFTVKEKHILRGLDLAIPAGEIHALIGTNGTGKSTLAQLVMGCEGYVPTRGDIVFHDRLINKLSMTDRFSGPRSASLLLQSETERGRRSYSRGFRDSTHLSGDGDRRS